MFTATWRGNAFFEIAAGDVHLAVDPWIRGNPGCSLRMDEFRPGRLTHVFVTHGHPGHWGRGDSADIAAACVQRLARNVDGLSSTCSAYRKQIKEMEQPALPEGQTRRIA